MQPEKYIIMSNDYSVINLYNQGKTLCSPCITSHKIFTGQLKFVKFVYSYGEYAPKFLEYLGIEINSH